MYDRILVPTDGSDAATKAAVHGFGLAKYHTAAVDLLYVVDEPPPGTTDGAGGPGLFGEPGVTTYPERIDPVLEEMGSQAVDDLAGFADELDVEAATEVLSGRPEEAISRFADEQGVDLIVMGTRDRSGMERLLHRSTTDGVLRATTVPVLVVHADEDELGAENENEVGTEDEP
ncbi:universal stress protein [Halobacteriales archaeon QS_8_65_32]|jgi:nucleotide-binding universal stress UspA family protein|nr:MAG: universal stress protein [Halobacteriales archaeon QS_8_65_32]